MKNWQCSECNYGTGNKKSFSNHRRFGCVQKRIDSKKKCRQCKEIKPTSDFFKRKKSLDGLKSHCKVCDRKYVAKYYYKNIEKRKSDSAKYNRVNMSKIIERNLKDKVKNPHKWKARQDLRNAVKQGKIIKPIDCEMSDISSACFGRLQAHHENYNKPLKVKWLCLKHHKYIHRKYKQYE